MKLYALTLFVFLFMHSSMAQLKGMAEIYQRVEEWKNAYNANDIKTLSSFYTEDADYVSPHVPGLMISGKENLMTNFKRGITGGGHVDSVIVLNGTMSCDIAYLVCKYVATNSGVTVSGRNILIMKNIENRWLIVTHASIIKD